MFLGATHRFRRPVAFISHASVDKPAVDQLVEALLAAHIDVWYSHTHIGFGDSIPEKISGGLEVSDALLVVLSVRSLASGWVKAEYESFLMDEIESGNTMVIPVRIDDCQVPPLLRRKLSLNASIKGGTLTYLEGDFTRMCHAIKGVSTQGNLSTLTSSPEMKYHASLIAMVISGVIEDFPISKVTTEHILAGREAGQMYRTIAALIDKFQDLVDQVILAVGGQRGEIDDYSHEHLARISTANRRLDAIHDDMKTLATCLTELAGDSDQLAQRFMAVSGIAVRIENAEGIASTMLQGPGPLAVADTMPREYLDEGGGMFSTYWRGEIAELNEILRDLHRYRNQLRTESARLIAEL
ncbi:TIR domain-containing protein [Streptomyces sp. NPDC002928]|uniref:toll/interleukin-1 receptor domain-containing protein n=1 Tax=Streptomyces sp. NPDC002928 TaxID=3154440 RepID=UPI0033AB158B